MSNWKLRKDKLKIDKPAEESESEAATVAEVSPVEPMEETTGGAQVFDLSGAAFRTEPTFPATEDDGAPTFASGPELRFLDDDASATEPTFGTAPTFPVPEDDAEAAEAFTPYRPDAPASPLAMPVMEGEPAPYLDSGREASAPMMMPVDAESGIPRTAPFIVEVPPPAEVTADNSHVLVLRLGNLSANLPLVKDVTTIGRPDSTIGLYPDVEIELDDAVSRRHAEVRRHDGQFTLVDTGSTNGTRLNGETLTSGQEYPLAHGDRIHVGERTEIIFE